MEQVVKIVRMEDYCPSCDSKYSIELYDVYNNPLGLTRLLNRNIIDEADTKKLSYMKCKKCGKEYRIHYYNGKVRPLYEDMNLEYKQFKSNLNKRIGILFGEKK